MSLRHLFALSAALMLAACAPLKPQVSAAEKRYSAAELLVLKPADFIWPATSLEGERALREAVLADMRARIALPPGPERDAALPRLFDLVAQYNLEIDAARPLLLQALPTLANRDPEYQRALLTGARSLYAAPAEQAMQAALQPLLTQLKTSKPFAVAAYTLMASNPGHAEFIRDLVPRQFPQWRDDPRLLALMEEVATVRAAQPPLADLLAAPLRPGFPVIYSLQRPGRNAMGLVLVRGADGRFVRDTAGRLFAQPQLALSRSGLPGTITNGNTPQGVFTIVGAGTATNPNIGPTPYLHSKLPIEATPAEFEHGDTAGAWSEALYESFLPASWRGHAAIKEAWLAGRAGRDELLIHGTTINPAYYAGSSYFPGTPQQGCMISNEDWDPATGRLLASRQLALAQAYAAASGRPDLAGYLVVVEVIGQGPVARTEAQALVASAGR
ncbi:MULTISPECIES: hypothetical protein [unclassified Roseateles]|uniref:hypothetical protein n=1 Tax=unclassified Roseateles TaxID=2626991 RepID=UPI0006F29673|nr:MULTISPECIES: hypothetical protein [unclassified Roseateles]KQW44663.1 hypothetical protein ASC81_13810 [Pelomonas sp. Root405]KRA70022.1 hypothetical protein ASD88_17970 [Pelomonas sp. Root662]